MTRTTRRALLRGLAGTAVASSFVGTAAATHDGMTWQAIETATANTLHDAARTTAGVHVVGASGVVLGRTDGGYERVLASGPAGNGNALYGADVTDDGAVLWVVGASGAVGAYDVRTGALTDHSAPNGVTNNFTDVAVAGPAGDATVHIAGDSGRLYASTDDGRPGTWQATTPGNGAAINAVDLYTQRAGHAVDADGAVFGTADGRHYDQVGIADADYDLYAVDSGTGDLTVSGGGGSVYTRDATGWHREDTGDADLRDVARCACGCTFAVGGGGLVLHERNGTWRHPATPTGQNLHAVLCCGGERHVAVGAGGAVIEK